MPHLKLLRERDSLFRLELAVPNGAVEANPAPDDMDMLNVGVVMADHDILVIAKAHAVHKVGGNLGPFVRREAVAGRQGKAGVPDWASNAGPRLAG